MSSKTNNLELNINYQSPQKQVDMKYGYDENFQILDESIQYILGTLENTDAAFSESIDLDESYFTVYYTIPVTWNGLTEFNGNNIWSDGINYYYSYSLNYYYYHYKYNKSTNIWEPKSFNFNNFGTERIWHVGNKTYYSSIGYYSGGGYQATHKIFNSETEEWENMTWNGTDKIDAICIWHSKNHTYYSNRDDNLYCVLNEETNTWEPKEWYYDGVDKRTIRYGMDFWTDGETTYYSSGTYQYMLDEKKSTWRVKNWGMNFYASGIWYFDNNIFLGSSYILKKDTLEWKEPQWETSTSFSGTFVWHMEDKCYFSREATHLEILRK